MATKDEEWILSWTLPIPKGSVDLKWNTRTGYVYPHYHVVFEETLSTVEHMRKGTDPGNWKNLVEEHSHLAIQEKFTLSKEWHINEYSSMTLTREPWK